MTKVSVLMPVYNTNEVFLRESIESILNQTFQDFELIIVDDGSSEDIESVVKSFKDSRIKFHKNDKNRGVGYTRNRLIDLAVGEYVAFQDSDDISLPQRLEKQVKFLDENSEISLVGCWLEEFPQTRIYKKVNFPKILDLLGGGVVPNGVTMLRLIEVKKHNLKYNETFITSEDYDFCARSINYLRLANVQEVLYKYRKNPNSLMHTKTNFADINDAKIKQMLLNNLTEDKIFQKKIMNLINSHYQKKLSFSERIFSIRNEWEGCKKYKKCSILGIGFKIKAKSK